MSKQEFLYRLETLLMDLPKDERDDALDYYEQYFEAAGPEREQEVIRELGSPEKVSRMIHSEGGQEEFWKKSFEQPMTPHPKKNHAPLWIALGVIGAVFVLLLVIGIVNFTSLRTETVVRYSQENTEGHEQEGLTGAISGFVGGIMDGVMDEVENSLEDGLSQGLDGITSDKLFQEIEQELESASVVEETWDGMQDDYAQGQIATQQEGSITLKAYTPVAWKGVQRIRVNLSAAAVLFCQVSGETLQVETSENDRIQATFDNETITLENLSEADRTEDDKVVIFLPEGLELDSLEISSESGYFETGNLQVEEMNVQLPDGAWKNSGTIHAGTISFDMGDGYLETGDMTASKSVTLALRDGVINAERLESPEISMECRDGVIRGTLAGTQEDYRWKASVGDGMLQIGDQNSWESLEGGQGEKELKISVNDGAARISFEE